MRWSRITLRPSGAAGQRRTRKSQQFKIELPLMSDGRIALHELTADRDRALVEQAMPEGGIVTGDLIVRDNQCIFAWHEESKSALPPIRVLGGLFFVGALVALRPGSGPAQLYEVVTCDAVSTDDQREAPASLPRNLA